LKWGGASANLVLLLLPPGKEINNAVDETAQDWTHIPITHSSHWIVKIVNDKRENRQLLSLPLLGKVQS